MATAMALMPVQLTVNWAVKSISRTGMVLLAVERVSWLASACSFQEVRKAKLAADARPERASGNSTFQNASQRVQPSMRAAARRSLSSTPLAHVGCTLPPNGPVSGTSST